ncbi:hypothetical protein Tco_0588043 [Tanacetum coccineum]
MSCLACINSDIVETVSIVVHSRTSREFSVARTTRIMAIVGWYGPSKMHFLKPSPFGLASMYLKKRDHHCAYRPVGSIAKTLKKGETLKKGSPFKPDSETNIPLLRPFQLWKKARYEALRKSDQMHQAFEKGSIGMTYKLGDMIEFPKSQPKKTYKEDLECNLDKMEDEVGNLSPESTPRVLPSFKEYTPPVTYSEEVEECWIIF